MSLKTCHECDWIFSPFKDEEICNDCDSQIRPEVWCSWCEEKHEYDCGVETRKILANILITEVEG